MKHFIFRIFIFIIPGILASVGTILYYKNQKQKVIRELNKIAEFECLILGDSQMQRLDPEEFSCSTYNFASAGEHYFFTYQKLKKLINVKDNKIQNIILGVSMHNFAPVYNRLFNLNFSEGQSSLLKYLYFIDLNENIFIRDKKELLSKSFISGIYKKPNWGGFYESNHFKPDTIAIIKTLEMHYGIKESDNEFSQEQLKYLKLINKLCRSNNIKLFIVSTPYHPFYLKNVDLFYSKKLKNVISDLEYPTYINYLESSIDPNLMSDGNHLNAKGSKVISEEINEIVNAQNYFN